MVGRYCEQQEWWTIYTPPPPTFAGLQLRQGGKRSEPGARIQHSQLFTYWKCLLGGLQPPQRRWEHRAHKVLTHACGRPLGRRRTLPLPLLCLPGLLCRPPLLLLLLLPPGLLASRLLLAAATAAAATAALLASLGWLGWLSADASRLGRGALVAVVPLLLQRQHPVGDLAACGAHHIGDGAQLAGVLLGKESDRLPCKGTREQQASSIAWGDTGLDCRAMVIVEAAGSVPQAGSTSTHPIPTPQLPLLPSAHSARPPAYLSAPRALCAPRGGCSQWWSWESQS